MKTFKLFIILLVCFGFSGCVLLQNSETKAQQEITKQTPKPNKATKKKKTYTKKKVKTKTSQYTNESADEIVKTSILVNTNDNSAQKTIGDERSKVINGKR